LHFFWTALLGCIAAFWVIQGTRTVHGMSRLPRLANVTPSPEADCPYISVIFAARNEAEKLSGALETLLAMDYPRYEVVGVDDRSQDATPQILDQFARASQRLKVVRVTELPPGWLGKPHALERAYEQASGDWLVFTDADVHFAPDSLRRAMALVQEKDLDHLTLIVHVDLKGFWETTAASYFSLGFAFSGQPWRVSKPSSRYYLGVGAFQLLRRSTYQAIGTHRRLALEVVDDMKLGKLVKLGGFRSGVGFAEQMLRVRWHEGLCDMVRGVTKNLFAACGFRMSVALGYIAGTFAASILPFLALLFTTGLPRLLAGVAAIAAMAQHARLIPPPFSRLYALTHPLGAAVCCYMMARSMVLTLWRGGVIWRGTFYPLEELRRGLV